MAELKMNFPDKFRDGDTISFLMQGTKRGPSLNVDSMQVADERLMRAIQGRGRAPLAIVPGAGGGLPSNIELNDGHWIGIGASSERIVFDSTNGDICLLGANVGIRTREPQQNLDINGGVQVKGSDGVIKILPRDGTGSNFQIYNPTGGDLRFYTTQDLVTIGDSGNVGIGTTGPGEKLDVSGNIQTNNKFITQGLEIATRQTSWITNDLQAKIYGTGADGGYPWNNGNLILQPRSSQDKDIILATGSTTPSPRIVIKGDGKIGIGTTGPDCGLHIGDAGNTSHSLSANDDCFISGKLEVDGNANFDGSVLFWSTAKVYDAGSLILGSDDDCVFTWDNTNSLVDCTTPATMALPCMPAGGATDLTDASLQSNSTIKITLNEGTGDLIATVKMSNGTVVDGTITSLTP